MIFTTEYIRARAFLLHTNRKEDGHLFGDVLMMDLDTLRQDVKHHTLYPGGVNIEQKDGSAATVSLEKWHSMELYEKDALKSWGFSYLPEQVTEWQHHYSNLFSQWKAQAFSYMPQDLEELLNVEYMEAAQNPDMDMYRIPMGTAKQMLLYDEAPVYRLLPKVPEKLPPPLPESPAADPYAEGCSSSSRSHSGISSIKRLTLEYLVSPLLIRCLAAVSVRRSFARVIPT